MVQSGDKLKIKIEDLAYGGDGVGHLPQGRVVFVPGSIPGEEVKIMLTKIKKNYARAKILQVLSPSPARVEPRCQVYRDCGGCQLQHIEYRRQLKLKREIVAETLSRIGKLREVEIREVIPVEFPWLYRNHSQYPLKENSDGEIEAGFYKKGTHDVISSDNCEIQHPLINRVIRETLQLLNQYQITVYDEQTHSGLLRHLNVRVGVCTGQAVLTIVTLDKNFKSGPEVARKLRAKIPELTGVVQNINPGRTNVIRGERDICLEGRMKISDYLGRIKYKISPASFFQVNTLQTEKLYQQIVSLADFRGQEVVVDCYSGLGSIALYLANKVGQVVGIEEVPAAVEDAEENKEINNIKNCSFICGQVEEELPHLQAKDINPDLVIVDPPRRGLKEETIETLKSLRADKLIYVSCNPTTLARDLKLLTDFYSLRLVQPVDMFPQTYHIENVTLLTGK
ncbi:MAG: 23S rRNA (uracil(1939)-C(5))-methyltransferase RlmD [Halanaerobiales bacterium]